MLPWLKFFRVVNLPTVPGDVLVGAAVGAVSAWGTSSRAVVGACVAAIFLYLFGLADNDLVGAPTDTHRPIPDGAISPRAASLARGLCLFGVLIAGALADLPPLWWCAAGALARAIAAYNRLKLPLLMGLCRGLNVAGGGFAVVAADEAHTFFFAQLGLAAVVWTLYIAFVTRYSAGEETDPAKKRRVGVLIGALVYLQLAALIALHAVFGGLTGFLAAGAALLLVLRLLKRALPKVSAS
jgi:hypothetical protein